jgi:5-methylcytosine-specific restriction endonuclease McrA
MCKIIKTHISKTGGTKIIHSIYGEPKSGTYADYVLLKEYYKAKDVDNMLENMKWQVKLFHHWNFLIRRMNECNGNLTCVYCGQEHLIIQPVGQYIDNKEMATVDHFHPKAKGGEHFDEDNMVVSCSKCNSKKGDNIWSIDTLIYIEPERRKIFVNKFG